MISHDGARAPLQSPQSKSLRRRAPAAPLVSHSQRLVYSAIAAALPFLLIAWARVTAPLIHIPAVQSPATGCLVAFAGLTLLVLGITSRTPPAGLPRPVHTGAFLLTLGASLATGSASGLWLISPLVALACVAMVSADRRRHPHSAGARILPEPTAAAPTFGDLMRCYACVLIPWLVLYEAILVIGVPPDAISGVSRFEQRLPVIEWTQFIYLSTYVFVLAAPALARTRTDLRRFWLRGWWTMAITYPAFLFIPLIAPKRPFIAHSLPGHLLLWQRTVDSAAAAFPSFHVSWAILGAGVYAAGWPKWRWLAWGWTVLICLSCIATSQHSILDVAGGAATVLLVARGSDLWNAIQSRAASLGASGESLYTAAAAFTTTAVLLELSGNAAASRWQIPAAVLTATAWFQAFESIRQRKPSGIFLVPDKNENPAAPELVNPALWRTLTALALTRLWCVGAPLHLIAGLFLILAGLAEINARRTPRLPVLAVVSFIVSGVLITALGASSRAPYPRLAASALWPAAAAALTAPILFSLYRSLRASR